MRLMEYIRSLLYIVVPFWDTIRRPPLIYRPPKKGAYFGELYNHMGVVLEVRINPPREVWRRTSSWIGSGMGSQTGWGFICE